jgi:hypothetical protein
MGAGYHPDGGDCYHHGAPGEFHVGQGLSQRVWDEKGNIGWAAQTKAGKRIFPFNPKSYERAKARGVNFRNYTGQFKDQGGHKVYVPKKQPTHVLSPKEYNNYLSFRHQTSGKSGRNQKAHNQTGRQGRQQNQKKKRKNDKVDSALIDMLQALKAKVDEFKGKPFPAIRSFTEPSPSEIEAGIEAFKQSFDNSQNDFVGRNPDKKWPNDLVEWKFPSAVADINANSSNFYKHVSKLKRGIAQLLVSTKRYKASKENVNHLAQAIAKENGMGGDNLNLEIVVSALAHKNKDLKLHSPEHIFAVLPKVLVANNYGLLGTTTQDLLADIVKDPRLVDERTYGLLIANNFKLLNKVLKSTKRRHKDEMNPPDGVPAAPPRASASSAGSARGKLVTEFNGLVGMSGDHVY